MRWKAPRDQEEWHPYFAWFPVTVGRQRVWLEWIERKLVPDSLDWSAYYRNRGNHE
jgi:hypothetical protein